MANSFIGHLSFIPFILQVAALLAAFTHPSHIVIYAPGDSFTCRRAATRNLLGICYLSLLTMPNTVL
ncbi:hypothetical protein C5470_03210 [Photorhabdus stackebrandtii]|uniref:Uncharacterized protein n=1 Tax=Photorhabdus stackebrandtii TaxID=1123042 RepID=A0A7X5QJF7_9GAMM|nr:hypothetical protein [Photorhabdus stackebrandtii]